MAANTIFSGVAVVTGAAGTGIGAATAEAFAQAGCTQIAITDLNAEKLGNTKQAIERAHAGVQVYANAGDISDSDFTDSFMAEVVKTFGRLDYAVNCAGILGDNKRSTETTLKDHDRVSNINYRGCWLSSRAELAQMLKQDCLPNHDSSRPPQRGAIVNIASQLGIVGRPTAPAYCASKAAVISMTRCDAIDYSKDSIRVNCICPGVIDTPMTTSDEETIQLLEPAVKIAPMQRMGKPEEIADAALFLCSTKASFVQGHAMVVDGGYIIN